MTKAERERKAMELVKAVLDGNAQRVAALDKELGGKLAAARQRNRGRR
jgi:hypothetical protein